MQYYMVKALINVFGIHLAGPTYQTRPGFLFVVYPCDEKITVIASTGIVSFRARI
jgi:hypothetical protein